MKMKWIVSCIACALVIASSATDEQAKKLERWKRMMIATGGMAEKPGKGQIVVLNSQKKISAEAIKSVVDKLEFQTKFNVQILDGEYEMYVKHPASSATIVLADDPKLPLSVIAVENLWGLVNVAKLGNTKTESRFTKEFIRVSTLAFGAALSRFTGSPLSSVSDVSMLDNYPTENYTYDCQQAIVKNLSNLGMSPRIRTSYKKACQEGWANAPTNEYQKAIWDKVHAMPKSPIKIKPETKKVTR